MKHKWKKIKRSSLDQVHEGSEDDLIQLMHIIKSPSVCINCGLRKGHIDTTFFAKRVYYKDRKIKSLERIPYKCPNKKDLEIEVDIEAKINNYEFIKQNEFEISA
jgi:hypothetical protein